MSVVENFLGTVDYIIGAGEAIKYDEEDLVVMNLAKPPEKPNIVYGLAYRVNLQDEIVITGVIPDSLADMYNANCDQEKSICTGDKILRVNEKTAPREILDEIKASSELEMTLVKSGPRWHINGVVSESMERIFTAKDKGLAFEVQEADLVEKEDEPNLSLAQFLIILVCVGLPNLFVMAGFSDTGFGFKVFKLFAPDNRRQLGNIMIFVAVMTALGLYTADYSKWKSRFQKYSMGLFVIYLGLLGWFFKMRYYPQVPMVASLMHIPAFIGVLRVTILKQTRRGSFYTGVTTALFFCAFFCLGAWLAWMIPGEEGGQGWKGSHVWNEPTKRALVDDADPLYSEYRLKVAGKERRIYFDMDCAQPTKTVKLCTEQVCRSESYPKALDNDLGTNVMGMYCCNRYQYDARFGASVLVQGQDTASAACVRNKEGECPKTHIDVFRVPERPNILCCAEGTAKTGAEKESIADYCAKVKTIWFLVWMTPFVCFGINFLLGSFCFVNGIYLNVNDASKLEKTMKQFIILVMVLLLTMWISISIAGASMRLAGTLMAFCAAGLVVLFAWVSLEVGAKAITVGAKGSRLMQYLISAATNDWLRALLIIVANIMIPIGLGVNMLNQFVRKLRGVTRSTSYFTDGMQFILTNLTHWNWSSIFLKMNIWCLVYWTMSIGVAKITSIFLSWLNETLLSVPFVAVCGIFFVIGFIMFLLPPVPGIPVYMTSGIVLAKRGSTSSVGFFGGILVAIALSFVLKLSACTGQYLIGFFMSKSVKIQQMVGVDKVFTRAIQKILEKPGIPLSKVSVLVGGPDWPTSVLCGILRLSICQILLGTCPVIFVSTPVVLSGGFMAGPSTNENTNDANSGIWDTLTPVMLGISGLAQLASAVIAVYYIQEVVTADGTELAKPRKEHEPVAWLTKQEMDFVQAHNQVLQWTTLQKAHKYTLCASAMMLLFSCFCFCLMDEACFRAFAVNKKISDSYEDQGLAGNAMNILKPPGIAAHIVFILGAFLHFGFLRWAKGAAAVQLKLNRAKTERLVAEGTLPSESQVHRGSGEEVLERQSVTRQSQARGKSQARAKSQRASQAGLKRASSQKM